DVDHLDVLARPDLVGERRGACDLEIEAWVGEWVGQRARDLVAGLRATYLEPQVAGGNATLDHGLSSGQCRDGDDSAARRLQRLPEPGRGLRPQEICCNAELLGDENRTLAAVDVANGEPVALLERENRRRSRLDAVGLPRRVERGKPRDEQARACLGCQGGAIRPLRAPWPPARRPVRR